MDELEGLSETAARMGVILDPIQVVQLEEHFRLLQVWNRRMSLVSAGDVKTTLAKHYADSLALIPDLLTADRIADLGTGAGFPGFVLAVGIPTARISLIDSNRKKMSFLSQAIAVAKLTNARTIDGRIEDVGRQKDYQSNYSAVVSRALTSINSFLAFAAPLLIEGGKAIAMKGPRFQEELDRGRAQSLGFTLEEVRPYLLPHGSERFLVQFRYARNVGGRVRRTSCAE